MSSGDKSSSNPSFSRRIAVSRLHMPEGPVLSNQVVEFDAEGYPICHYPLTEEIHSTEWHPIDYYWDKG